MSEVIVEMPLHITYDMLAAVTNNELTKCEDKDEMYKRIGWLICAWDVMVKHRTGQE